MEEIQNQQRALNNSLLDNVFEHHQENTVQCGMHQCIPFPWKLHEMLEASEKDGFGSIVSWLPDGKSFKVNIPDLFVASIVSRYFNHTKYRSFQRQLNIWCFERLRDGPGRGGYTHPYLLRGKPSLCQHMTRRQNTKQGISKIATKTTTKTVEAIPSLSCVLSSNSPVDVITLRSFRENKAVEDLLPQDGDCVFFEGRNFHFLSDYTPGQPRAGRRFSLDFSSQNRRSRSSLGTAC
jgi:hypothetical protein